MNSLSILSRKSHFKEHLYFTFHFGVRNAGVPYLKHKRYHLLVVTIDKLVGGAGEILSEIVLYSFVSVGDEQPGSSG